MKKLFIIILILLVVGVVSTVFTIDETEQVVILQFGQPVRIIKEPGLNFKLPAPIQVAQSFDKRLLEYDVPPEEILSKDKKSLIVDNYVRWKIIDPLLFLQTVQTQPIAKTRIKEAEEIKGEGEAKAVDIYARAFSKDPEFYEFYRSLEAYKKIIDKKTTLVLPSNSNLFETLNK